MNRRGRFVDFVPVEEQKARIRENRLLLKRYMRAPFQILTPKPQPDQPDFPTRVILNAPYMRIPIPIPYKALAFYFEQVVIAYPPAQGTGLASPALRIALHGTDRKFNNRAVDVRLFTSPGTRPDPTGGGDRISSEFAGAVDWRILLPAKGTFMLTVEGWDGTDPEYMDIAFIGRSIIDRVLLDKFTGD